MALENLMFIGDGTIGGSEVRTAVSAETILDVVGIQVLPETAPSGIVSVNDVGLAISCVTGLDKAISITSDGTLIGTTIQTEDCVNNLTGLQSFTIHIDVNGLRIGCRFQPSEVKIVGEEGEDTTITDASLDV